MGIEETDANLQQWKLRRLINLLEGARGNGTSMISLVIRARDDIAKINKMLADEFGTASNIKSRVNRLSVLSAITSAQQKLKLYSRTPPNGLVIYCGTVIADDGKEKKISMDFEPFKPINTSLYLCDNKFHVEALRELLATDETFGFIVMDGNGALFSTLQGNVREILHRFVVDLPKKHGRGGQSAVRFARLRLEKRHNYVRKVAELASQLYISQDKLNVAGVVLAGSADFKNELAQSDLLDKRITSKIIKIVDICYGGEMGLNQAVDLAAESLANVKFVQEKKIIGRFFDEIHQNTGKAVYGVQNTIDALEMGAIELLLIYEALDIQRVTYKAVDTGEAKIKFVSPSPNGGDQNHGAQAVEIISQIPLTDWLVENYSCFGAAMDIVSNKSQEGSQFQKGFGGVGGILRYMVKTEPEVEVAEWSEDEFM